MGANDRCESSASEVASSVPPGANTRVGRFRRSLDLAAERSVVSASWLGDAGIRNGALMDWFALEASVMRYMVTMLLVVELVMVGLAVVIVGGGGGGDDGEMRGSVRVANSAASAVFGSVWYGPGHG